MRKYYPEKCPFPSGDLDSRLMHGGSMFPTESTPHWRNTFFGKHEHGDMQCHRKTLTYLPGRCSQFSRFCQSHSWVQQTHKPWITGNNRLHLMMCIAVWPNNTATDVFFQLLPSWIFSSLWPEISWIFSDCRCLPLCKIFKLTVSS